MKNTKKLIPDRSGFIREWLVCGPKEELYTTDYFNPNQLEFEKKIREIIADESLAELPSDIRLGKKESDGMEWFYYSAANDYFVDLSTAYGLLTKVEYYAATTVCADCAMTVDARLWTFDAVEVWVNGALAAVIKEPVYKPINHKDFKLELKEGRNEVFVRVQNLGVRDTRNIFGIQLKGNLDGITLETPDFENVKPLAYAKRELMEVGIEDGCLVNLPSFAVKIDGEDAKIQEKIPLGEKQSVRVSADINGREISRDIENSAAIKPIYSNAKTLEEHREILLKYVAEVTDSCHKELLLVDKARDHVLDGKFSDEDFDLLKKGFIPIRNRADCADFVIIPLIRTLDIIKDKVPADFESEFKDIILSFRYWMDEKGSDGMCFWSENHAIGFYTCQLMAGKRYPDDVFVRSGRTGRQQYEIGNNRCREWFDSIEATGFEEFMSPGYMCVTLVALFALIDYADKDVAERAKKTADRIFRMICTHFFNGGMIAPNGRIYGNVIRPFVQGVQSVISYFSKDVPMGIGTDTIGDYRLSSYTAPSDLEEIMNTPVNTVYQTGNAQVSICKTDDYILTSVASERDGSFKGGWDGNEARKENPYETGNFSFMYVKALNEKYHGTTLFQPGVYGYQQHMWSAGLSNECVAFATHPGGTCHDSSMRPGYWYGNGIMPALRQWDNTLLSIYVLDEDHPIDFTHLYFPKYTFDETKEIGNWVFGKKNNGIIGIWCSAELEPHNDYMIDCEYRAYSDNHAYVCICSDVKSEGSFDSFCEKCLKMNISYNKDEKVLDDGCGHSIKYIKRYNDSQVI